MPSSSSSNNASSSSSSWMMMMMAGPASWNEWGVVLFSWWIKVLKKPPLLLSSTMNRMIATTTTTTTTTTTQCEALLDGRPSSSSSSSSSLVDGLGISRTSSSNSRGCGEGMSSSLSRNNTTPNTPSSSPSSSTAAASKDNNATVAATATAATKTIAHVLLELGFWVVLAVLTQVAVRRLLGSSITSPFDASADADRPPASLVHKRIHQILVKRHLASQMQKDDGDGEDEKTKKAAAAAAAAAAARIVVVPPLDSYELQMAEVILDPDDIESSFADIGGLDQAKQEIYELAVLPLVQPDLFSTHSKLIRPVKGILLYGRPGTGKTMLAKALAKESAAVFIPLQLSKILNKWVGESNKLIAATFSLAHKLEPAIIFIDELDTFLKANNSETSAYLDNIKSEFLTCWDGVATKSTSRVLVLGATNKPQAIDPAILRRMPRTFAVPLPDAQGRLAILELLLADENLSADAREYLPILARGETVGYSGSDLEELAKAAAMVVVQERTAAFSQQHVMGRRQQQQEQENVDDQSSAHKKNETSKQAPPRPISRQDLEIGLSKVQRTGAAAKMYGREVELEDEEEETRSRSDNTSRRTSNNGNNPTTPLHIDVNIMHTLAAFVRAISEFSHHSFPPPPPPPPPANQPSRQNLEDDDDDDEDIPDVQ